MKAFRLVKARHADSPLDGEGAMRAGGRWNSRGVRMVYGSGSLALATLELLVHLDPAAIPEDLVAIALEVPDSLAIQHWRPGDLPPDWRKAEALPELQARGDGWIRAGTSGVLVVPSVVVPTESNILLNPSHPDIARIRVTGRTPFSLDPRLFS